MLFHVTLEHDAAHCPGYHRELMPVWIEGIENRNELAERLGVKIHSILNGAPDHVVYVIAEADRPIQMAMFVAQLLPSEQANIRTTAVEQVEDMLAYIQQLGPPPGS